MRGVWVLGLLAAGLAGCVPITQIRPENLRPGQAGAAAAFCTARASGDAEAVAALFVPEVAAALRAEAAAGRPLPLQSAGRSGPCTGDRLWAWGGSRSFAEVRYAGGSDGLDLWLSGQGLIADLVYGDGSGTLRERLGVPSHTVPPPAGLFRR
jgi:hypothetical protein